MTTYLNALVMVGFAGSLCAFTAAFVPIQYRQRDALGVAALGCYATFAAGLLTIISR